MQLDALFLFHSHCANSPPRGRGPHRLRWHLSIPATPHPPRILRSPNPPIWIAVGPGSFLLVGTLPLVAMEPTIGR